MAQQDFDTIIYTLDRLTTWEKLVLLEHLARSLREPHVEEQVSPAQQRAALQCLRRTMKTLPIHNPPDGFSNRDHDRLLYGAP
jgi:hypothetical protein